MFIEYYCKNESKFKKSAYEFYMENILLVKHYQKI